MDRNEIHRVLALAAIGVVAIAALAACNGDDDDGNGNGGADTGTVVNAIVALDRAGLHEIDEAIRDGKVPPTARATALQMQTLVALTPWPENLRSQADALAGILGEMAEALDGEPVVLPEAQQASVRAHVAQHEFSGLVWAELYGQAGVNATAHGHND